jgi:hypothetical protein
LWQLDARQTTFPAEAVSSSSRTRSTWGAFESLVAEKCGTQSTQLTAIDKDTGNAYLYAVGHANGTATVIKGLGKLPGTFKDPVNHLVGPETADPLNGE